eukprot:10185638-Lingulodinium_polyedra.AAC.1
MSPSWVTWPSVWASIKRPIHPRVRSSDRGRPRKAEAEACANRSLVAKRVSCIGRTASSPWSSYLPRNMRSRLYR